MNYFQAKRAERLLYVYKELALRYWQVQPEDMRDPWERREGVPQGESEESFKIRQQINLMFPEVNELARQAGAGVTYKSYPAPAVGGPILPVNMLASVVDQQMGHAPVSRREILDVIDRSIGAAGAIQKREFRRMLNPLMWPIEIAAFIVRIPFLILRKAGLPASVEENIVSQVIKTVMTLVLLLLAAYLGLEKYIGDVLKTLGK